MVRSGEFWSASRGSSRALKLRKSPSFGSNDGTTFWPFRKKSDVVLLERPCRFLKKLTIHKYEEPTECGAFQRPARGRHKIQSQWMQWWLKLNTWLNSLEAYVY